MGLSQLDDKIATVLAAWSNLRPNKSFAGLTLDEFKAAIKPSMDMRASVAVATDNLTAAIVQRDNADAGTRELLVRVAAAVVADESEGNNGELYKAMGYVRRDERAPSGRRRSKGEAPKEVPLAKAA